MHPTASFQYCPSCGSPDSPQAGHPFRCGECGFVLYVNTTCATAAFLERPDGTVLFIRRAKDPAKGMLAIPGGFIDPGETAEFGLRREFQEEVGLAVGDIEYLCSHPNVYNYRGISYQVLDFFFTATSAPDAEPQSLDGVASFEWLMPEEVDADEIAFPSMREAMVAFLEKRNAARI